MADFTVGRAHIWRLPNELLRDIFDLAAAVPPKFLTTSRWPDYIYDIATIKAIILTSSRCYNIGVSFLYRSISLICYRGDDDDGNDDGQPYMPGQKLKQILDSLQRNPLLGTYCLSLNISLRRQIHASEPTFEGALATPYALEPLITFLPQIQRLRIEHAWAFRDEALRGFLGYCAAYLLNLRALILKQELVRGGPSFLTIDECSQFKSLRELKFSSVNNPDITPFKNTLAKNSTGLKSLLIGEALTSQGLTRLLQWPRQLEKVAIGPARTDDGWISLEGLHAVLLKHRQYLTHLHVGDLVVERPGIHCDFAEFPNLRYLRMPMRQMTQEPDGDIEDAFRILAPRLEQFALYITHEYVDDSWIAFNSKVKRFVRTLAEIAIERRLPLREIHIAFSTTLARTGDQDHDAWKEIQDLDEEFQPKGVAITHSYNKAWIIGVDEEF